MNINELFFQAKIGDEKAKNELFKRLAAGFGILVTHRITNQQDAEDLVQEALATIIAKYENITIEHSFSAWAHKVLEYHILNYYRIKTLRRKKFEKIFKIWSKHKSIDHDPLFRKQLINCFKKIIKTNNRYARVLNLHFHGYNVKEICNRLGISQTNLYTILLRARFLLMRCIEEGDKKNE